jgi:hypothetical protein
MLKIVLLLVNHWQLASTRCQQAATALGEFTKLVYDSKFKKLAKGMSFVNAQQTSLSGLGKQDFGGSGAVQLLRASSEKSRIT